MDYRLENKYFFICLSFLSDARTHPVSYDKIHQSGPVYVTIGNSGWDLFEIDQKNRDEEWLASFDLENAGFGILTIENATTALWETRFHGPATTELIPNTDRIYIENHAYHLISRANRSIE